MIAIKRASIIGDLTKNGILYSCLLTAICVLLAWILAGFSESRRDQLRGVSHSFESALLEVRAQLAEVSSTMAADAVLARGVKNQKINTYSAKLKDILSTYPITHIGIYTKDCKLFYMASQEMDATICQTQTERFHWSMGSTERILTITRPLGEGFLIAMGQEISDDWLASLGMGVAHIDITYSQASPLTPSHPLPLSYLYSPGFHLFDTHPLSQLLAPYVSPYGEASFPLWFCVFLLIISLILLAGHHYGKSHHLEVSLSQLKFRLAREAKEAGLGEPSLPQVLGALKAQVRELRLWKEQAGGEISDLKKQNKAKQSTIARLTMYKYLVEEVERTAGVFVSHLQKQSELEDDTKDFLEMIHRLATHPIASVLKGWQADIHQRGARKFLRSSLEMKAEKSHQSVLETDVELLLEGSEQMVLLSHSLLKHSGRKSREAERIEEMAAYWNKVVAGEAKACTLSEIIDYAAWQIRHVLGTDLDTRLPQWIEPKTLEPKFALVLRSLIYEIFAYLCQEVRDGILTLHYVPSPTTGLLITHGSKASLPDYLAKRVAPFYDSYGLKLEHQTPADSSDQIPCFFLSWGEESTYQRRAGAQVAGATHHSRRSPSL